jgi:predicted  nucleic acid-binding Zn-ribbon protein
MSVDPIERLTANARRRSEQTLQKAQNALTAMAARGAAVTVASLAKNAEVSRSWIYTQPELRDRIEQLHQAAPLRPPHSAAASRASLESLKRRLDLAHQRITQLRYENGQLRRAVEHLHGQLRDRRQT